MDATSLESDAGLLIAFYRDPEFNFLGPGNLRINLDVAFPNGTTASLIDYAEHSIVESCANHVTGTWLRPGASYKFRIARDMSSASVILDAPLVRGTVELHSIAPPRCADGTVWSLSHKVSSSYNSIPGMYWMEPMSGARSSLDLNVKGSHLAFQDGIGGFERIWQSRTWFDMLRGYKFFRAVVGPYTMSYWSSQSRDDPEGGLDTGNVLLSRDGKPVFSSSRSSDKIKLSPGLKDDHFAYRPTYSGSVRSSVGVQAETGYDLVLISPVRKKQWSFHFEHKRVLFEFNLGRAAGGTAFMGPADGGEKGSARFQGSFLNERVDLSSLWIPTWITTPLWAFHYSKVSVLKGWKGLLEMIAAYQM